MSRLLWCEIPMRLQSAANIHAHWRERQRRVKQQRQVVALALKGVGCRRGVLEAVAELTRGGVLRVTLTRISPRKLDSDNLANAFKAVRDEIATQCGEDDGSEQWEWVYQQEPGRAAIRIEVAKFPGIAAKESPLRKLARMQAMEDEAEDCALGRGMGAYDAFRTPAEVEPRHEDRQQNQNTPSNKP